jgi:hypothetical protein
VYETFIGSIDRVQEAQKRTGRRQRECPSEAVRKPQLSFSALFFAWGIAFSTHVHHQPKRLLNRRGAWIGQRMSRFVPQCDVSGEDI